TIPGEPISGEPLVLKADLTSPTSEILKASPLYGSGGSNLTLHHDAAQEKEFTARSYVTAPNGPEAPLNLVVVVEWSLNSSSEVRSVVARSSAFNTESGCGSADNLPYATACQDFYTASAKASGATISIVGHTDAESDAADLPEILYGSNVN